MTAFVTCRSCADRKACDIRAGILDAIRGLRITSVKHSCGAHRLPFEAGQAVWAKVQQCPATDADGYYGRTPSHEWFPAHFVGVSARTNTRGLVFIALEAPSRDNNSILFYPVRDSEDGAVCKIIWDRIELREGEAARTCPICKQLKGMKCEGPPDFEGLTPPCPMKITEPDSNAQ